MCFDQPTPSSYGLASGLSKILRPGTWRDAIALKRSEDESPFLADEAGS
ncbi:MAG: hypothetical protein HQ508_05515 [Candidatus Marinimicrobia bacterium]|nr:hypothetical protein [Candidatus Neomarinimicrobiota bacterium]